VFNSGEDAGKPAWASSVPSRERRNAALRQRTNESAEAGDALFPQVGNRPGELGGAVVGVCCPSNPSRAVRLCRESRSLAAIGAELQTARLGCRGEALVRAENRAAPWQLP
jgi:hypothetical protein